jgi:thiamine-monophosphate kinase
MRLSELSENRIVEMLTKGLPLEAGVLHGAGDDCAVLDWEDRGQLLLFKADCVVEGVHFSRSHSPQKVGWKALCRAISDIAAMAGRPRAALVTVAAPQDLEWDYLAGIYSGLKRAARAFPLSLVGGETSRSPGPLFLNVSLLGSSEAPPILRSGAGEGDAIAVTGRLGGSFASGRHLRFVPRVKEALWLRRALPPTAMMDLSDGLAADLPRLAACSGLGFELDFASLPRARACGVHEALTDGEDYELLFTFPAKKWPSLEKNWKRQFPSVRLSKIGRITRSGQTSLEMAGFAHFHGRK